MSPHLLAGLVSWAASIETLPKLIATIVPTLKVDLRSSRIRPSHKWRPAHRLGAQSNERYSRPRPAERLPNDRFLHAMANARRLHRREAAVSSRNCRRYPDARA